MLLRLQEQGYHLPVLKVLSSVTPLLFKHKKVIVNDQRLAKIKCHRLLSLHRLAAWQHY